MSYAKKNMFWTLFTTYLHWKKKEFNTMNTMQNTKANKLKLAYWKNLIMILIFQDTEHMKASLVQW